MVEVDVDTKSTRLMKLVDEKRNSGFALSLHPILPLFLWSALCPAQRPVCLFYCALSLICFWSLSPAVPPQDAFTNQFLPPSHPSTAPTLSSRPHTSLFPPHKRASDRNAVGPPPPPLR